MLSKLVVNLARLPLILTARERYHCFMNAASSWFTETLLSKFKWLMIFALHRECFNLHNYTCINYALTGSQSWVHSKVSLRERCHMWRETVYESANVKGENKEPNHLPFLQQEILLTATPSASTSTNYLVKRETASSATNTDTRIYFLGFKHCDQSINNN